MKYIKTKDGIYKTRQCYPEETLFENVTYVYRHEFVKNKDIIAKADTIEELCDEFIGIDNSDYHFHFTELEKVNGNYSYLNEEYKAFYGTIWTDKGLIYVAKLNEQGELELL